METKQVTREFQSCERQYSLVGGGRDRHLPRGRSILLLTHFVNGELNSVK